MNNIDIRKTERFIELTPKTDYVLTTWNENDNIMDFTYSYCVVIPVGVDYSIYHSITTEKALTLEEDLKNEIEKIENV